MTNFSQYNFFYLLGPNSQTFVVDKGFGYGEGTNGASGVNGGFCTRSYSLNFQSYELKSCSDWVLYFSSLSEIWSFFLIFYFVGLFFFVYYIFPEATQFYRISSNFSTPQSWMSSLISCGVPFILIFSVLYESIYLLFINEVPTSKISPLFLIEGKQWKWEYRFNLVGLLEHSYFKKVVGSSTEVTSFKYTNQDLKAIVSKFYKINGSEAMDTFLRTKAELLKAKKSIVNSGDFLKTYALLDLKKSLMRKELTFNFSDIFTKFRVNETARRMVLTNKMLLLPDLTQIKAHITGCDVIHSWTLPNLGLRIDAVPGKIYTLKIPFKYYGIFSGQCSEVCGLRHAYMPICVGILDYYDFIRYLNINLFFSIDLIVDIYLVRISSVFLRVFVDYS